MSHLLCECSVDTEPHELCKTAIRAVRHLLLRDRLHDELQADHSNLALRDVALAAGNVLLPYLVAALLIVGFQ